MKFVLKAQVDGRPDRKNSTWIVEEADWEYKIYEIFTPSIVLTLYSIVQ
jgi:hypothetical protein